MTKKKCSVLIGFIEDKFKQWEEKLNNNKKLNEVEEVRQQDLRKENIMIFGGAKKSS